MKNRAIILIACLGIFFLTACNDESEDFSAMLTAQQEKAFALSGKWGDPSNITIPDGTTANFESIELEFKINPSNYYPSEFTAYQADGVFEGALSTWAWGSPNDLEEIILNNVSPIEVIRVVGPVNNEITVSFSYPGPSGGRSAGIGQYQFTLHKIE